MYTSFIVGAVSQAVKPDETGLLGRVKASFALTLVLVLGWSVKGSTRGLLSSLICWF